MKRSKQMKTLSASRAAQARESVPAETPVAKAAKPARVQAPPPPPKPKPRVGSKVMLVQSVLYQNVGGKYLMSRPGHKTLPKGSSGIVMSESEDRFQVKFRAPLQGLLQVTADEITAT